MKTTFLGIAVALSMFAGAMASSAENTSPLVVIALVKVKPGYERLFRAVAASIIAPTRDEPGNISYDFHQSTEDSTEFATYETWNSESDLDGHMNSKNMQQFFQRVGGYFEQGYPVIKKFEKFDN